MAGYCHRSFTSMNFQPPAVGSSYYNPPFRLNNADPPCCSQQNVAAPLQQYCKCCERMTTKCIGPDSYVEHSRCCEHCHHPANTVSPPYFLVPPVKKSPERQVVITTIVPEKALKKPGVTLHLETIKANNIRAAIGRMPVPTRCSMQQASDFADPRFQLMAPPPAPPPLLQFPMGSEMIFPPAPSIDSTRSSLTEINERQPYFYMNGIRPSTSFVKTSVELKAESERQPGMQEFMQQYRNRMKSTSIVSRSLSQLLNQPPLPTSDIALRNCRRWYH